MSYQDCRRDESEKSLLHCKAMSPWRKTFTKYELNNLRQSVGLQESRTASKTISMWTKLLSVAGLAVNITIRTIASNNWVQGLVAIMTLETLAMPLSSFSKDFFSSEYNSATTRTTFSWWSFDDCGINYRCLRRSIAKEVTILKHATRVSSCIAKAWATACLTTGVDKFSMQIK